MLGINFKPGSWWDSDTDAAEVISAVSAFGWSIALLVPGDAPGPLAAMLRGLLPEVVWALFFAVIWGFQSLAMCGNRPVFRRKAAFLAFIFWGIIAGMTMWAAPFAGGTGTQILLSLANVWVLIRRTRAVP